MRSRLGAVLAALAVMALASPATFALVLAMNKFAEAPEEEASERATVWSVQQKKSEPKQAPKMQQRQPKPRRTETRALTAPAPTLKGSSVGGVQMDVPDMLISSELSMPQGDMSDMDEVGQVTSETADKPPVLRQKPPIRYPAKAREEGVEGKVVLNLLIGTDGNVKEVHVVDERPAGVFTQSAINAAQGMVFEPSTFQGRPAEVWAQLPLTFELNE